MSAGPQPSAGGEGPGDDDRNDHKDDACNDELMRARKRDALQRAAREPRKGEIEQALDRPSPSQNGHEQRQPVPDIVKSYDQSTEIEVQQAGVENSDIAFLAPMEKEFHPRPWLHDVRDTDNEAGESDETFNGDFHAFLVFMPERAEFRGNSSGGVLLVAETPAIAALAGRQARTSRWSERLVEAKRLDLATELA